MASKIITLYSSWAQRIPNRLKKIYTTMSHKTKEEDTRIKGVRWAFFLSIGLLLAFIIFVSSCQPFEGNSNSKGLVFTASILMLLPLLWRLEGLCWSLPTCALSSCA